MGGTTTDIAMVLDGKPVKRDGGISIGKWDTFVDSAFIHTLGLGGDSRVRICLLYTSSFPYPGGRKRKPPGLEKEDPRSSVFRSGLLQRQRAVLDFKTERRRMEAGRASSGGV